MTNTKYKNRKYATVKSNHCYLCNNYLYRA